MSIHWHLAHMAYCLLTCLGIDPHYWYQTNLTTMKTVALMCVTCQLNSLTCVVTYHDMLLELEAAAISYSRGGLVPLL